MRIVVWNCAMALNRKIDFLRAVNPDIAIVPEAAATSQSTLALPGFDNRQFVWIGSNRNKGLAILSFGDWELTLDESYDNRIEFVAPVRIKGRIPMRLLAVWAFNPRAETVHPEGPDRYQVRQSLDVYRDFLGAGDAIVAGDFNNAKQFDKPGHASNHMNAVDDLAKAGLVSAYHAARGVDHGSESEMTHYWRDRKKDGRSYHIDYCFIPSRWASAATVSVGTYEEWVTGAGSDHVPLIVDIDEARVAPRAEVQAAG